MIIGISGKIGSGKDLTGSIIQYLTSDMYKIDNFTFQEWLNYGKTQEQYEHNWEIKKFAGKLKQIASLLTGIDVKNFEDQEFKKTLLGEEWGTVQKIPLNSIPPFADIDFNIMMSVREFLQKLGTEAMRDGLHQNVWVNALFADYKGRKTKIHQLTPVKQDFVADTYPNWIITDVRFPNELEAINDMNGLTIRVVRPQIETANFKPQHPSETSLDSAEFNYTIINDGSIDDLIEKVRQILITEKII